MQLENVIKRLLRFIHTRIEALSVTVTSGGVDTMEKLQYVRGQIRSLEDLQQDLKDLLKTTEYEDEQVHGDTETD